MMTPADRREQVRDVARYLRGVRPLVPEELVTYITGDVTPDAIRSDLAALAVDLEIVDRGDGTFVPVAEEFVAPPDDHVTGLPDRYTAVIEEELTMEYGSEWEKGDTGDRLRSTITELKADYYRQHPVEYDTDVAFAYAIYHLASYFAAGYYLAAELAHAELLDYSIRLLDVGAGVGGPALGFFHALPADALVEYHAIEPSAAADILESLLAVSGRNVHPTIESKTAEAADPEGPFDVILFGNVLIELTDPLTVTNQYLDALDSHGTMVLLSAADKATSTGLRQVERGLVDNKHRATVFGPTVRLWPNERPTDRGWSFTRRQDIAPPSFQDRLAGDDDSYRHTSVQYSYSFLRLDDRRRHDVSLSADTVAKMGDMDTHVTNRVDVVGAKLSPDLGSDHPLFKVSDGSESTDHYAVLVHESPLTQPLLDAGYGDLLTFENVLVLWNDDEAGYNLVVDDQAVVEYY